MRVEIMKSKTTLLKKPLHIRKIEIDVDSFKKSILEKIEK